MKNELPIQIAECYRDRTFLDRANSHFCRLFGLAVSALGWSSWWLHRMTKAQESWLLRRAQSGQHVLHTTSQRDAGTFAQSAVLRYFATDGNDPSAFFRQFNLSMPEQATIDDLLAGEKRLLGKFAAGFSAASLDETPEVFAVRSTIHRSFCIPSPWKGVTLLLKASMERQGHRHFLREDGYAFFTQAGEAHLPWPETFLQRFIETYNGCVRTDGWAENAAFRILLQARLCAAFSGEDLHRAALLYYCQKIIVEVRTGRKLPAEGQMQVGPAQRLDYTFGATRVLVVRPFDDGLWINLREAGHASGAVPALRHLCRTLVYAAGRVSASTSPVPQPRQLAPQYHLRAAIGLPALLSLSIARSWWGKLLCEHEAKRLIFRGRLKRELYPAQLWKSFGDISYTVGHAVLAGLIEGIRQIAIPVSFRQQVDGKTREFLDIARIDLAAPLSAAVGGADLRDRIAALALASTIAIKQTAAAENPRAGESLFLEYWDGRGLLTHALERLLGNNHRLACTIFGDGVVSSTYACKPFLDCPAGDSPNQRTLFEEAFGENGIVSELADHCTLLFDPSQIAISPRHHTRLSIAFSAPHGRSGDECYICVVAPSDPKHAALGQMRADFIREAIGLELPEGLNEGLYCDFDPADARRFSRPVIEAFLRRIVLNVLLGPGRLLQLLAGKQS